jgi:hypothetical protein
MNKFDKIYHLLMEDLNPEQKELTDKYANKRNKTLSFGPMFKEERTYFPLDKSSLNVLATPEEVLQILDENGLYCPDYRQRLYF